MSNWTSFVVARTYIHTHTTHPTHPPAMESLAMNQPTEKQLNVTGINYHVVT